MSSENKTKIKLDSKNKLSTSNLHTKNLNFSGNQRINNKSNSKNIGPFKKFIKCTKIHFNDYELNSMDYRIPILNDKRKCCKLYLALLKSKNAILFSFCPRKDYNSLIIRLCIFSLSFSIYYAINFAFFTDEIMHVIYEKG